MTSALERERWSTASKADKVIKPTHGLHLDLERGFKQVQLLNIHLEVGLQSESNPEHPICMPPKVGYKWGTIGSSYTFHIFFTSFSSSRPSPLRQSRLRQQLQRVQHVLRRRRRSRGRPAHPRQPHAHGRRRHCLKYEENPKWSFSNTM